MATITVIVAASALSCHLRQVSTNDLRRVKQSFLHYAVLDGAWKVAS